MSGTINPVKNTWLGTGEGTAYGQLILFNCDLSIVYIQRHLLPSVFIREAYFVVNSGSYRDSWLHRVLNSVSILEQGIYASLEEEAKRT